MKVRHRSPCAGPCTTTLLPGARAVRAHRTLWCLPCYRAHAQRCTACRVVLPAPVPAGSVVDGLW